MARHVKLLFLEDNPSDVRLVKEHLKRIWQLEVDLVHVDRLALAEKALDACAFDVALFDLNLPDGAASETLHLIREAGCAVPIVVLTGFDDDQLGLQAMQAGAQDYLTKEDIGPRQLYRAITYAIERKAATDAMRMQSAALNASANVVIITDAEGVIQWVNPAFEEATGYSLEESIGRDSSLIKSSNHPPEFYASMWTVIRAGDVWAGDVVNRRKDGSTYTADVTITPLGDDHDRITGYISIQQDVTELREAQAQLEDRTTQLNERIKELHCLHDVTRILDEENLSFADKMIGIVARLPDGWLDPVHAVARIRVYDQEYLSARFAESKRALSAPITVEGQTIGEVMVAYDGSSEVRGGATFLSEERSLIQSIAAQIARAYEKEAASRREHINHDRLVSVLALSETTGDSAQQYIDIAVDDMVRLTSSEYGYIRLLGEEAGRVRLDAWSRAVDQAAIKKLGDRRYMIDPSMPCGIAVDTRQPVIENDGLHHATLNGLLEGQPGAHRYMVVPIMEGDQAALLVGMLNKPTPYTSDDIDQVRMFAISLSNLVRSRSAELEVRRRIRQLELVNNVASRIALQLNLGEVTQRAAVLIQEAFNYEHVGVFILEGDTVWMRASAGQYSDRFPPDHHLRVGVGMVGGAAQAGKVQISNDVRRSVHYHNPFDEDLIGSEIAIPITARSTVIGVLDVQSSRRNAFDETDHIVLCTLADQLATAIINARLYEAVTHYNETLQLQVESAVYELQRAVEQGAAILDNSPIGILLLDRGGVIEVANPASQAQFGMPYEPYGRKLADMLILEPPLVFDEIFQSLLDSHEAVTFEAQLRQKKDESPLEVEVALAQVVGSENAGVVCTVRDISAFKEIERMKDRFVSNVSHELRTPITGLKLNHRLLERDPGRSEVYLKRLGREIDRLNVLIEDLLRLSRLDQGRVELDRAACNLNDLINHHVADRLPIASTRGIAIDLELGSGLPLAWADPGLTEQVLSVLLTNALNYNSEGNTIVISSGLRKEGDGRANVYFCVNDDGPGISAEDLPHLSDRFYRGEASRNTSAPGTGLGLAIAREIVQQHQGRLEIESSGVPGEGAAFRVLLPVIAGENQHE